MEMCGPLKGSFPILGLRDFLQRKKFPDKKGPRADPHLPPSPPPSSPGKKTALKMKLPGLPLTARVTSLRSSHASSSTVEVAGRVPFSSLQLSSSAREEKPQA